MWYEIAASASALLTPLLPTLLKIGEKAGGKAVEKIGESIGKDAWERAKRLWDTLSPGLKQSPEANSSISRFAADVEGDPKKVEAVAYAFTSHLEGILKSNEELAQKVAIIVKEFEGKYNQGAAITVQSQIAKNIFNATTIHHIDVH